jgi:hypothetical protein
MIWDRARLFADKRRRAGAYLVVLVFLIVLGLVWFAASGVRGSDQYWYVADVESLIEGRGVQTNEIYPVSVRHDVARLPRPFLHNRLNLYIVALPALLLGAYGAWIAVNVVSGLVTSVLVYCTIVRVAESRAAALTTAVAYLLLPLTFWLTTQPLVEASTAPLAALAVYVYVTANGAFWRWALLVLIGALLAWCREPYVLLLPLIPLAYLVHVRPLDSRRLLGAGVLLTLGVGFWVLGANLFEPYLSVTYWHVLTSPRPGGMSWWFDLNPQALPVSAILAKAVTGLENQFTRIDAAYLLFFLPFNIMAAAPFVLLLTSRREDVIRVGAVGLIFLALHFMTVILVQNNFRYLLTATPPLLVAAGVLMGRTEWFRSLRVPSVVILAGILVLLAPCAALAWYSHDEGVLQRDVRNNLAVAVNQTVPADDTVMVAVDRLELRSGILDHCWCLFGYVLRPRPTLYVLDRYTADDYAALIENVHAEWLLSPRDSPIFEQLVPAGIREVRLLPAPFSEWSLFAIESRKRP